MSEEKPRRTIENLDNLTVDEFRKLKDAILAYEQGKALRRLSTPEDDAESESLGNFGPLTNFSGELAILYEELLDELCYIPEEEITEEEVEIEVDGKKKKILVRTIREKPRARESKPIRRMIMGIFRASGSKGGKRMQITGETIAGLGQFNSLPEFQRPVPKVVDLNKGD